ncbi:AraC family transcriptional regulator [Thalassospira alkalitolerans]|uniref:AraC family transcriptional regulator n=1 Tax=Thalassospira alkalitolerans TaxID=1293890 RepID=A0A1Y2L8A6_9PROT|nr:AraC family transcriptional regulator [Thalassospira alkalitolerans]
MTRKETISACQIEQLGSELTPAHEDLVRHRPLMCGRLSNDNYQSFMNIHTTNTVAMRDAAVSNAVGASVTVAIVLKGRVCGTFKDVPFDFDAREQPVGFVWALSQPVLLSRQINRGEDVSKVMVSVKFDWVRHRVETGGEQYRAISDFIHAGIAIHQWQPSRRAIALADQLLYPHTEDPLFRDLYAESRGLEIFAEALGSLHGERADGEAGHEPDPLDQHCKAQEIRDYVTCHILDDLTLTDLSLSLGMSIANLQRVFKNAYGTTIKDFMRESRLIAARDAMEKDGLTIGQAAWLAGYSSPANFATAFKRVFGISPSDARDR